ncbi:MAG: Regulator of protease activity HflC, stomatin/prohibitin superfamily [Candidatus Midichloria mitochondrii]|uniref:Membrane protease subunit, stomatin/prohibitin-like protein n=1 Tax=Midichloria mitochondrii (strain IricVA) TaxID=696127 RepID=F7XWY8_MIDMI|nr:stomatin-like protein [Candidatus Midichloria mitochondrii]AEI89187.1 membrane protease subunit, stomatin/prohibitin-like protein [Candidatus Midichloria mitochondrii IricVA]MDJ1256747.1 paraslipin [Candidatus Midichloria mitochondrii]MDJ1288456.1 paraslipin [Candidatus Midichloria mitochondrii]MDJ1299304.1 paraslipin [Candidatus Midichloria mitochondrii]MDJ1313403.1 paraslipin [Candidatus Midichloria mitochondrii]
MEALLGFLIVLVIIVATGIKAVPQQESWIVERLGKYDRILQPGLNFIIPIVEKVAYKHTLKETVLDVLEQSAITKDNVSVLFNGVLYVRIINPVDASYGVENPYYAATQLAQTSMRSAIGKLTLDRTFEEREFLNAQIVNAINEAASTWGIQCMRYEIRDIKPPANVLQAMETQVAAERQKRAEILESEGRMQAAINLAEAKKREVVLNSEAIMTEKMNFAQGEASAIKMVAESTAAAITSVAASLKNDGGTEAASLKIAEQYVNAFKELAKTTNTVVVPANTGDASGMIAQALALFNNIKSKV